MRLCVVSTWWPDPPDNGSRLRAYHLLEYLTARHTVRLLSFDRADGLASDAVLRTWCERVHRVAPTPLPTGGLGLRGLLSVTPRYFVQAESARMRALVAEEASRCDAALAMQVNAAVYLAGQRAVPRVFDEVETGLYRDACAADRAPLQRWRGGLTWWKYRHFLRGLVNGFDRSTVVSSTEREHLAAIGCDADRIVVVPNGAVAADVLPARTTVAGRLIYPGSVTYSANLDAVRIFVRDIFPLVRRGRPDATFVVTGATGGVDLRDLESVDGVMFTGHLPDVDAILATSAACVVPLRMGGGTRLKILRAMALGTPVVSTGKGIEGLEVVDGREVLVADEPQAFAARVSRLLDDQDLAAALANRGHALVRSRYGWESIGARLEETLQGAVVASRGIPA